MLLEDSNENTVEKRKRTEERKSKATDSESGVKSIDSSDRSNVIGKMLNYVGKGEGSSVEEEDLINIQNFSSSDEDRCEESQSLIQPSKRLNFQGSPKKIKGDQGRKDSEAKSKSKDSGGSVNDRDIPFSISSTEDKSQSEDSVDILALNDSERPTSSQSAMMEQDQEISSSQLPPLPKQEEPEDEIGQKLFKLKLPPALKTKVLNYWKHK